MINNYREEKFMDQDNHTVHLVEDSRASAKEIYALLSDFHAHMEWGGKQQWSMFRLISLDAPAGSARVGAEFTSHGKIPWSSHQFEDHSVITEAKENSVLAFTTYSEVRLSSSKFNGLNSNTVTSSPPRKMAPTWNTPSIR